MDNIFEKFKTIQQTHSQFKERAMKVNATVENATQNATRFKESSMNKFKVDTPEAVEQIINEIDANNAKKLEEYEKAVKDLQNTVLSKEESIKRIQEESR